MCILYSFFRYFYFFILYYENIYSFIPFSSTKRGIFPAKNQNTVAEFNGICYFEFNIIKSLFKNERRIIFIMTSKKNMNIEIKKINRSNIYRHFLNHEELTKQNLVSDLQLCLPTVTKNVDELVAEGFIEKAGSQGHTGGRRAVTYSIVRDAKVALGIDVTLNHVTVVAVDLTGNIISFSRHRMKFKAEDTYYQYVGNTLTALIKSIGLKDEQILGVGIGLPALVDADRKSVFFSKIINLSGTTLGDFARYIPYSIQLFNDANAAAFTEMWMNRSLKNAFYLMLSNNIGGAMIINGTVYSGDSQHSGEVGHITLVPGGKRCYCGQPGCVDSYLAATNLSNLTDGNLQAFFDGLKAGDKKLTQTWDTYLNYLASTVNIVHVLLDCNIILGGYVGEYLDPYMDDLCERAAKLNTFSSDADYLKTCLYKKESIAAGAAMNFIEAFIQSI